MELAVGVCYPSALCFWIEQEDQACFVFPYCGSSHLNVSPASHCKIIWEDLGGVTGGATIIGI